MLEDLVVPVTYRRSDPLGYWTKFLSACLLYDPPEDDLEGFASYADPDPITLATEDDSSDDDADEDRDMLVLPITYLRDPDRAKVDTEWFFATAILDMDELLQQKLEQAEIKPDQLKIDLRDLFREVAHDRLYDTEERYGSLYHEYVGKQLQNKSRPFIDPSHEETTEDDIRAAFREIRKREELRTKTGRPNCDLLEAIQCAFYVDRCGWSIKDVAKYYRFSESTAKNRIRDGRQALRDENT
jgi:hypothetical protein